MERLMEHSVFIIAILWSLYNIYSAFWGNLTKKMYDWDMMPGMPKDFHKFTIAFRLFTIFQVLFFVFLYVFGVLVW
jgi:hypothetical protein